MAMHRLRLREGILQDHDQIRMDAVFSDYWRKVKVGESKNLAIKYTPILFEAIGIKRPQLVFRIQKVGIDLNPI